MVDKARRVAIYARVSTDGQTVDNQLAELGQVAERHGWEVVCTHVDQGVSGARGRDRRPGFDAICTAVAHRDVDMVVAWSVDRLGRSLRDLVTFLGAVGSQGRRPLPARPGARHVDPGRAGDVRNAGRVRRIRAQPDPGAGPGRPGAGQGAWQAARPSTVAHPGHGPEDT